MLSNYIYNVGLVQTMTEKIPDFEIKLNFFYKPAPGVGKNNAFSNFIGHWYINNRRSLNRDLSVYKIKMTEKIQQNLCKQSNKKITYHGVLYM